MTLVGLVPPLCDNGNMLVDGGYSAYSSLSVMYTSVLHFLCSGQSSSQTLHEKIVDSADICLGCLNAVDGYQCRFRFRRGLREYDTADRQIQLLSILQIDDNSPRNFGDTVSGIWLMINRWNPFSSARQIPPITEIQSRLA